LKYDYVSLGIRDGAKKWAVSERLISQKGDYNEEK